VDVALAVTDGGCLVVGVGRGSRVLVGVRVRINDGGSFRMIVAVDRGMSVTIGPAQPTRSTSPGAKRQVRMRKRWPTWLERKGFACAFCLCALEDVGRNSYIL
jgi:hypothetical protein